MRVQVAYEMPVRVVVDTDTRSIVSVVFADEAIVPALTPAGRRVVIDLDGDEVVDRAIRDAALALSEQCPWPACKPAN